MQYATDVDISITGVATRAYGVYTVGFSGSITDVTVDLDLSTEGFNSMAYGYGFRIEVDNRYVGVVQGCTATVRVRTDDRSEDVDYGIAAIAAAYGISVRAYAP